MPGNIKNAFFLILFFFILSNCSHNSYLVSAKEDPQRFLAKKDSLLNKSNSNKNYLAAVIFSHKELGLKAVKQKDYRNAIYHFKEVLSYDENDSLSMYKLNLAKGHEMYLKGKTDNLWKAIQFYSMAAQVDKRNGEPHYFIGLSYYKLDDKDFDLILESFNSALKLFLTEQIRNELVEKKIQTETRKKKLEEFWN